MLLTSGYSFNILYPPPKKKLSLQHTFQSIQILLISRDANMFYSFVNAYCFKDLVKSDFSMPVINSFEGANEPKLGFAGMINMICSGGLTAMNTLWFS